LLTGGQQDAATRQLLTGGQQDAATRQLLTGGQQDAATRRLLTGGQQDAATRQLLAPGMASALSSGLAPVNEVADSIEGAVSAGGVDARGSHGPVGTLQQQLLGLDGLPMAAGAGWSGDAEPIGDASEEESARRGLGPCCSAVACCAVRRTSLHLELLGAVGGHWLDVHVALLAALLLAKGAWLPYPAGWRVAELILLAVCFFVHRLQRLLGSHGNRAECAPALAGSVALSAPALLLFGYFTAAQVYVLYLEFVLGLLSLSVLLARLVISAAAGASFAKRRRETALVIVAVVVAVAAVSTMAAMILTSGQAPSSDIVGWSIFLAVVSAMLLSVSGLMMIAT